MFSTSTLTIQEKFILNQFLDNYPRENFSFESILEMVKSNDSRISINKHYLNIPSKNICDILFDHRNTTKSGSKRV
jgi:hypothetical protein